MGVNIAKNKGFLVELAWGAGVAGEAESEHRRETYYQRWRREHPRIQIYVSKETYEWLKEKADAKGVSMKDLVLEAIRRERDVELEKNLEFLRGFYRALDLFIDDPWEFYVRVIDRARSRSLKGFEPCLFTAPCMYCGKPIIFNYKLENYDEVKEALHEAFKNWYHVKCRERYGGV